MSILKAAVYAEGEGSRASVLLFFLIPEPNKHRISSLQRKWWCFLSTGEFHGELAEIWKCCQKDVLFARSPPETLAPCPCNVA